MTGRWPANVILSPGMAEVLDGQSGYQKDKDPRRADGTVSGSRQQNYGMGERVAQGYGSGGGASRYFLNAGYELWELEWIYSVGLRPCGMEAPDAD